VDLEFTSSKVVKKRTTGAAIDVSHTTARPLELVIRPIIVEETIVGIGACHSLAWVFWLFLPVPKK
jgi:hypothetical protein